MPSGNLKRPHMTGKLDPEERQTLIIPALGTFDTRFDTEQKVIYHRVPYNYEKIEAPPVWRVMLKFGAAGHYVVAGLDIYGDTVFGRGSEEADSPDIDLTNLGALERGVSRRHALLRPTINKLYLIDLNSTNGTFVNAISVSRGMAQMIRNHDGIAFAGLTCVVEIVTAPSATTTAPEPDVQGKVEATLKLGKPKTGRETVVGVKLPYIPATKTDDKPSEKPADKKDKK